VIGRNRYGILKLLQKQLAFFMKPITKFEEITRARTVLELPEMATMDEIKSNYRRLIAFWHPDRCKEMTHRIIRSYKIIMSYCQHYQFSFACPEVEKYATDDEWWMQRFGQDPLWSSD